jgi:uncharacterized membrane protein (UPF0182 family)
VQKGHLTREALVVADDLPGLPSPEILEPYYLILRLRGEPKEEFVLLIPFNPSKKDNLSAWLAQGPGSRGGASRSSESPR